MAHALNDQSNCFGRNGLRLVNYSTFFQCTIQYFQRVCSTIIFQGMYACDMNGNELIPIDLPRGLKAVGPNINNTTLLQSLATALHASSHPITGQTASKNALIANPAAFINPEQPLMYSVNIMEDDIRRQEERVANARRKLQDALRY